jgi:outer membrane protein TolC
MPMELTFLRVPKIRVPAWLSDGELRQRLTAWNERLAELKAARAKINEASAKLNHKADTIVGEVESIRRQHVQAAQATLCLVEEGDVLIRALRAEWAKAKADARDRLARARRDVQQRLTGIGFSDFDAVPSHNPLAIAASRVIGSHPDVAAADREYFTVADNAVVPGWERPGELVEAAKRELADVVGRAAALA